MKRKNFNIFILCCLIALILSGCSDADMILSDETTSGTTEENQISEDISDEADVDEGSTEACDVTDESSDSDSLSIYVFVCGAVCNEGVYELSYDARVQDALNAAGGFTEEASTDAVNLAATLSDGQKLYFPTKEEVSSGSWQGTDAASEGTTGGDTTADKVNINTATKEELMTLSGIGEAKAESIISYRETNGSFGSIEDIMNVSGIGESIYQKIMDNIAVQ